MVDETAMVAAGVDTHKDVHVLCVLDALGRKVAEGSFAADAAGYDGLAKAIGDPGACIGVGVEGTASYGAGLARRLADLGFTVHEVLRPKRDRRRPGDGKNDTVDAERAASDVLSGNGLSTPKSQDGWAGSLRFLMAARRAAVQTSTSAMNSAKGLLASAPEAVRAQYSGEGSREMMEALSRTRDRDGIVEDGAVAALRSLARLWAEARRQAEELEGRIASLLEEHAPALLELFGCGPIVAASLAVAAGDNPARLRSEASFAALCGASPVEASSGKTVRHRLNRGGNRQANCALYQIAIVRMRYDGKTREYVERRRREGKSRKEVIRCLKRFIAREVYRALLDPTNTSSRATGLADARRRLGVGQASVARSLGVSASTIGNIERGVYRNRTIEERYSEWIDEHEEKSQESA